MRRPTTGKFCLQTVFPSAAHQFWLSFQKDDFMSPRDKSTKPGANNAISGKSKPSKKPGVDIAISEDELDKASGGRLAEGATSGPACANLVRPASLRAGNC
jgi:hypothetical protein